MYTGIIDHCGEIIELQAQSNGLRAVIQTQYHDYVLGESIAINGVCVTVVAFEGNQFSCDLSPETCRLTNLKALKKGSLVNVERSLQIGDRLGGHFVMGHVDGIAVVNAIETLDDYHVLAISGISEVHMAFIVKKGSICINGVSLTINDVYNDGLQVMLIPHTWERTNLHLLNIGDEVNIEFDCLARMIAKQLQLQTQEVA